MEEVGVRELRDHLSTWLDSVKSGQEILVTERGRPVARLVPIGWTDAFARLIREGSVRFPKEPRTPSDQLPRIKLGGRNVSDIVIEQRRCTHT